MRESQMIVPMIYIFNWRGATLLLLLKQRANEQVRARKQTFILYELYVRCVASCDSLFAHWILPSMRFHIQRYLIVIRSFLFYHTKLAVSLHFNLFSFLHHIHCVHLHQSTFIHQSIHRQTLSLFRASYFTSIPFTRLDSKYTHTEREKKEIAINRCAKRKM